MRLLAKYVAGCFMLGTLGLVMNSQTSAVAQDTVKEKKKKVELKVKVGDPAPMFESVDETGKTFKSSDVIGKKILILFFYPSDFTGNGVAHVRGFQDEIENLQGKGAYVVGVSGDSASTHKLFKDYYKLSFPLLADEKGELANAFGIPVGKGSKSPTINDKNEKGSADRAVTIDRWTVIIDKGGNVAAGDKVDMAGNDAKRVSNIIQKLNAK